MKRHKPELNSLLFTTCLQNQATGELFLFKIVDNVRDENLVEGVLSTDHRFGGKIYAAIMSEMTEVESTKHKYSVLGCHFQSQISGQNILKEVNLYFGDLYCLKHGHNCIDVVANVLCETLDMAKINVQYCEDCNKYLLGFESYGVYQRRYKNIIVHLKYADTIYNDDRKGGRYFLFDLKPRSLLNVLGYNTSLPEISRRARLVSIIECKQVSKAEIINFLHFLIRLHRNNLNQEFALGKWKSDLEFVNDYNSNAQDEVYGKIVMKARQLRFNNKNP